MIDIFNGTMSVSEINPRSHGEQLIHDILIELNIDFIEEKTFNDLYALEQLRFDFYFEFHDEKCIIEFDGEHHNRPICYGGINENTALLRFNKQILYDGIKDGYAADNNIRLLRIPISKVRYGGKIMPKVLKKIIQRFLDDIDDEHELLG